MTYCLWSHRTQNYFATATVRRNMPFGINNFGTSGATRRPQYYVVPQNRQVEARMDPGGWKVTKGPREQSANTVQTFDTKEAAKRRAKELAQKNNTILRVYDAAQKTSWAEDYR